MHVTNTDNGVPPFGAATSKTFFTHKTNDPPTINNTSKMEIFVCSTFHGLYSIENFRGYNFQTQPKTIPLHFLCSKCWPAIYIFFSSRCFC